MSLLKLDIHTIIVLLSVGNFLALIILAFYRSAKKSEKAYIRFITGKIFQSIAWPLLGLRGNIPDMLSVYTGNSFLLAGFALEALALITSKKESRKWSYAYIVLGIVCILSFWFFADTTNIRVGIASLATVLIYMPASFEMIRTGSGSRLRFSLGALCGLFTVFLVLRAWYGFFSISEYGLMTPGLVQTLTFLQAYSLMLIGGIGFLLMLKEHKDMMLSESEGKYRTLVEKANEAIVIVQDRKFVFFNNRMLELMDTTYDKLINLPVQEILHPEDREMVLENYENRLKGEEMLRGYDFRLLSFSGNTTWVTISASRIIWNERPATLSLLTDITDRKNIEKEKEVVIKELQKALSDVKALSGLLPICSNCKKIRDDKGYWNQIEVYISEHSEADFSHSLCPDCVKRLYPFIKEKNK